jgi:hypothetical protein
VHIQRITTSSLMTLLTAGAVAVAFFAMNAGTCLAMTSGMKVCNSGEMAGTGSCPVDPPLGSGATQWGCTLAGGLLWQISGFDKGKPTNYTNYDNTSALQVVYGVNYNLRTPTQAEIDSPSNTIGFIKQVNSSGLCGFKDWRLPTIEELHGLSFFSGSLGPPYIDQTAFGSTPAARFWTSTPGTLTYFSGGTDPYAGCVNFWYAPASPSPTLNPQTNKVDYFRSGISLGGNYIRLVRDYFPHPPEKLKGNGPPFCSDGSSSAKLPPSNCTNPINGGNGNKYQ